MGHAEACGELYGRNEAQASEGDEGGQGLRHPFETDCDEVELAKRSGARIIASPPVHAIGAMWLIFGVENAVFQPRSCPGGNQVDNTARPEGTPHSCSFPGLGLRLSPQPRWSFNGEFMFYLNSYLFVFTRNNPQD